MFGILSEYVSPSTGNPHKTHHKELQGPLTFRWASPLRSQSSNVKQTILFVMQDFEFSTFKESNATQKQIHVIIATPDMAAPF